MVEPWCFKNWYLIPLTHGSNIYLWSLAIQLENDSLASCPLLDCVNFSMRCFSEQTQLSHFHFPFCLFQIVSSVQAASKRTGFFFFLVCLSCVGEKVKAAASRDTNSDISSMDEVSKQKREKREALKLCKNQKFINCGPALHSLEYIYPNYYCWNIFIRIQPGGRIYVYAFFIFLNSFFM